MPPAIIGGAIAAAGAVGSAVIGSKAASKASKASAQSAEASAAVQREIYGENKNILSPYVDQNMPATGIINSLLGIPAGPDYAAYVQAYPDLKEAWSKFKPGTFNNIADFGKYHWDAHGQGENRNLPTGQSQEEAAQKGFDIFRNSTGYQFRLNQGLDAVNSGYAGAGTIKSGAAMKGINDYAQGMASQEFGNYLSSLGNQQGVGLSAGSALAGVGQNYANSLGNIYMQNGANQANAALLKGQNIGQAVNSLATIGAGIFGRQTK